jgi:hypothetical protein
MCDLNHHVSCRCKKTPINSFRDKLFLQEDTIASDKHFALNFIIKIISFGFPRRPFKEIFV